MEYEIKILYSTIADLKREAARLLGDDLDRLQRDLDKALDDAATLRESLEAAKEKTREAEALIATAQQWLGGREGETLLGAIRRVRDVEAATLAHLRRVLSARDGETVEVAAERVARERDEARAEVERLIGVASSHIPGPTALDGVVGMLVRYDFEGYAAEIAERKREPAEIAHEIRSWWTSDRPGRDACIAALEALAAREVPAKKRNDMIDRSVSELSGWKLTVPSPGTAGAECAPNEQSAGAGSVGDRERLGRVVREIWISWAREQPSPKPSWLAPWEALSEPDREVDRRIGEQIFSMGLAAGRAEAKEEREALRKRVRELERQDSEVRAALGCHVPEETTLSAARRVVRAASFDRQNRDAASREAEELRQRVAALEEQASHLAADLHHAREQGAADMRERAATFIDDAAARAEAAKMHEYSAMLSGLARRLRALPIDGANVEEKR